MTDSDLFMRLYSAIMELMEHFLNVDCLVMDPAHRAQLSDSEWASLGILTESLEVIQCQEPLLKLADADTFLLLTPEEVPDYVCKVLVERAQQYASSFRVLSARRWVDLANFARAQSETALEELERRLK